MFVAPKSIQATVTILENLHVILEKTPRDDIRSEVLPLLFNAFESTTIQVQVSVNTYGLSAFTLFVFAFVCMMLSLSSMWNWVCNAPECTPIADIEVHMAWAWCWVWKQYIKYNTKKMILSISAWTMRHDMLLSFPRTHTLYILCWQLHENA